MFIGHYGVGLALKKADKTVSLGLLFLAVQFVDILWPLFVFLGIEKFRVLPVVTGHNPLDFISYPYSHSLVASLFWAGATYLAIRFLPLKIGLQKNRAALVLAIAVLSHFFLDLIVHRPDLSLWGDNSPKIGFGLWNYPLTSYILEAVLFLGGFYLYIKSTQAETRGGKYGIIILAIFLLLANTLNFFGPPPPNNTTAIAVSTLIFNLLIAVIAFWLDKKRSST